jgi:DNA-binding NtrC family response regulator
VWAQARGEPWVLHPFVEIADTASMSQTITLPSSGMPAPLTSLRPRLRLVYSPATGIAKSRLYSLPVGQTWLGRELPPSQEGIAIADDPGASSVHAVIEVADNDYHVRIADWRSKNGTYIGRTRLAGDKQWHPVKEGDLIRVGSTFFILRNEPAQVADAEVPTLIGVSRATRELRARIVRLAGETVPVLLSGETGTGKEVVARALHQLSRRTGEFVAINCAAIPESLAESELFGHAERSFTGAHARQGVFRRAHRGTLFLDEIGDMAPELQAKLLRVLEEHLVTPVGGDRPLPVDVRVVAATHHDLRADADAGSFRSDLHARLARLQLDLPPLRARREDVLLLLQHAWAQAAGVLTPELVQEVLLYDWPQNVREVLSVAERLRIDGASEVLAALQRARGGPASVRTGGEAAASSDAGAARPVSPPPSRPYRLQVPTREQLETLLSKYLGTVRSVAEELNCSRRQVQRWLELHNLDADQFRRRPGA